MSRNVQPIRFEESDCQMTAPTGFAALAVPPCRAVGCQDKDVSQPPQLLPLIVLPDPDIGGHWFARLGGVQVIPHDEL